MTHSRADGTLFKIIGLAFVIGIIAFNFYSFSKTSRLLTTESGDSFRRLTSPLMIPSDVSIGFQGGVFLNLCEMDFVAQQRTPHLFPMQKDMIAHMCRRPITRALGSVVAELRSNGVESIVPSGFIFHEARCGSTLVANSCVES